MSRCFNRRFFISFCWLGVSLALILFFGIKVASAANIRVSLEPAGSVNGLSRNVFDLITEPGSTIQDEATLRNGSDEAIKAFIFPSGFEVVGGKVQPVNAPAGVEPDPGTWITLDRQEVIVPAGGSASVKFSIKIPENLDVGEHQATLLAQGQSLNQKATNASGFNIVIRNGVMVYMVVPGQIDRTLIIHKISHRLQPFWSILNRKLYFSINCENKGNITIRPKADVSVRGWFGQAGKMENADFVKLGRGITQSGEILWNKRAPIFGRFVADFTIHLGEKEQVNEDRTRTMLPDKTIQAKYVFWIFPWAYLIYLLMATFVIYLLRSIFLYFVIMNRLKIKTNIYVVQAGDTLMKVAGKLGADPTVLAKFNFLPWPYRLEAGDKLLVPVGRMERREWKLQLRSLLSSRDFLGGILGHFFKFKTIGQLGGHLTRHQTASVSSRRSDVEILIAERGDTIDDVAEVAGATVETIIKLNHLRSPYRLRAGQELLAPKTKVRPKKIVVRAKKPSKKRRS